MTRQGHRGQRPSGGAQRKLLCVLQAWDLRLDKPFGASGKTKSKAKEFPVCGSHTGTFLVLTPRKLTPGRLRKAGGAPAIKKGEGGTELLLGWA